MDNDNTTMTIEGRTIVVSMKQVVARLKRDARISEELRQGNLLPSGLRSQTARWTGLNYSRNDSIDQRTFRSKQGVIIETRFADSLRREYSV
jgi:hypothetical protein